MPSIVVVALGEPGVPVVWTWAMTEGEAAIKAPANIALMRISVFVFMGLTCVVLEKIRMDVNGDLTGFIDPNFGRYALSGIWDLSPIRPLLTRNRIAPNECRMQGLRRGAA